jgi:hypothetical protein
MVKAPDKIKEKKYNTQTYKKSRLTLNVVCIMRCRAHITVTVKIM